MAVQARHPNVLYAQDKTKVYLTVDLQDALNPDISTSTESVKFKCQVNSINYEFEINLYGKVVENSWSTKITNRKVELSALKDTSESTAYWPRLQKESGKLNFVKTDFSKWVDEDEDDEPVYDPQGQFNEQMMFQQLMAQQGGMAGMDPNNIPKIDGQEEADSDDEDMPPLE